MVTEEINEKGIHLYHNSYLLKLERIYQLYNEPNLYSKTITIQKYRFGIG
jgi:hypothetical protein